ncbi:motility associated factor glycosyltransferase family protein [Alteromonas genovensis]|uniref:motility associated factor glycosyltransferase family protein n=1 Tax=Alteromonas genovensis TaxID=471225 RepID=UPI002FE2D437
MLNQIQLHIHNDEEEQLKVEEKVAVELSQRYRENVEAFRRYIPSLLPTITSDKTSNSTILCNKYGGLNLVKISNGQVVYGSAPQQDIALEVEDALQEMSPVFFEPNCTQEPDVLVIFGLGIGYHIPLLLAKEKFKHIVIYEPDEDLFTCSLSTVNWKHILEDAKKSDIGLFLQIGNNAKQFAENMSELQQHLGSSGLYYYKHLNNQIFDELEYRLRTESWDKVRKWTGQTESRNSILNYLPLWTRRNVTDVPASPLPEQRLSNNLNALKSFFPDVYQEFKDYKPSNWLPCVENDSTINLLHEKTRSWFYHSDAAVACEDSFDCFAQHPHKDGIVLGYKGKKLRNYLHYQMVKECESVLDGVEDESGNLPEHLKSVIFFGLAAGYDLAYLVEHYDVEKLFICEPNRDFFFASLYALDWENILNYFSKGERRLYLNIGDDGTHLTNDLLVQFQTIGPYVLANTYFYQSYYNDHLVKAISELREQLQVMIAMGDYFDNARYGTSHTIWAIQNEIPFLKKGVSSQLSVDDKDVPIFIVGNGPSLDNLLPLLKSDGHKGIVVSCGTALQTLYNNNILPDFHAEIEANRSTYDWAVRIGDAEYLKQITLISCNGIHPDTCALYKDVLLAFKQGEASTVSMFELYEKNVFAALNRAYPTVTNFAVDFLTQIGFQQFYLLGTDLGFVDEKHHHSKASGYYSDKGEDLYDYSAENNTSLVIPGNFRAYVNTKYEFKVSKSVLEDTLASKNVDVYNLNDGARIKGAQALNIDDALVTCSDENKKVALENVRRLGFESLAISDFEAKFKKRFSHDELLKEIRMLHESIPESFESRQHVDGLIEEQRGILVNSVLKKNSLLFFYLNGTLNYINSSFTKIANLKDKERVVELSQQLANVWSRYTSYILKSFEFQEFEYDNVTSFMGKRRELLIQYHVEKEALKINFGGQPLRCNSSAYLKITEEYKHANASQVAVHVDSNLKHVESNLPAFLIQRHYVSSVSSLFSSTGNTVYLPGSLDDDRCSISCNDETRLNFTVLGILSGIRSVIIVPKQIYFEDFVPIGVDSLLDSLKDFFCYGAVDFIVISRRKLKQHELVLGCGDRLVFIPMLKRLDLLGRKLTKAAYEDSKHKLVLRGTR